MISSQCPTCIHYRLEQRCTAFPDGIPLTIVEGTFDHAKPFPDDGGIRWEPTVAESDLPPELQGLPTP